MRNKIVSVAGFNLPSDIASGGLQRRADVICHAKHDARLAARMPVAFLNAMQSEQVQPLLWQVNAAISAAIPDAVQKISWSMPTYWKKRNLIQFAAFKKHIGLYPGPEVQIQ